MSDITAKERAESIMICSCPPASKEPKIHIFSCLGSQRKSVADQIRLAEDAARRKALEEAAYIAEARISIHGPTKHHKTMMAAGLRTCKAIAKDIRALMDNPNVS